MMKGIETTFISFSLVTLVMRVTEETSSVSSSFSCISRINYSRTIFNFDLNTSFCKNLSYFLKRKILYLNLFLAVLLLIFKWENRSCIVLNSFFFTFSHQMMNFSRIFFLNKNISTIIKERDKWFTEQMNRSYSIETLFWKLWVFVEKKYFGEYSLTHTHEILKKFGYSSQSGLTYFDTLRL